MRKHKHFSFNTLQIALITLSSFLLTSCEKEVQIDLKSSPPQVVVQGSIESGNIPFVVLNSSMSFFSKIDLGTLEKSFIHNAIVTVSDGSKTVTLKEYTVDTGVSFKYSVYTIDTTNFSLNNLILGEVGKTYTLSVTYEGKTYTGVTKIPDPQREWTVCGLQSLFLPAIQHPTAPANFLSAILTRTQRETTCVISQAGIMTVLSVRKLQ